MPWVAQAAVQEGMEGSPGRRWRRCEQNQGVATKVGSTFDGVAAGKSKAAFSDGQVGLP